MGIQLPKPETNDSAERWRAYWKAQGQLWRTEAEIDAKRQKELAQHRAIIPDIKQGIYPFKGIKLNRADMEWLLATHESEGRYGPIDWSDESQREREGLDLRGANLCQENLRGLPLAQIRGGLTFDESFHATVEQRDMAAILLKRAKLGKAQLQKANLREAQLQGAEFPEAQLQGANLQWAQLQGAYLAKVQLQEAYLWGAELQGAFLASAQLQGADLRRAVLENVTLDQITLSNETYGAVLLADVRWGDVNLAVVDWRQVKRLGDEQQARQKKDSQGKTKRIEIRLAEYKEALRANRQLTVVLREQGLNEEADYFAYHAQVLQKHILWLQMMQPEILFRQRMQTLGRWLFSWFLFIIAGYGYRPGRSLVAYLAIIFGFMGLYLLNAHFIAPHMTWDEALVLSVSSFHGRGFFTQNVTLGDTYARLAAAEAVMGLIIEISFIATFTQRFFGR